MDAVVVVVVDAVVVVVVDAVVVVVVDAVVVVIVVIVVLVTIDKNRLIYASTKLTAPTAANKEQSEKPR